MNNYSSSSFDQDNDFKQALEQYEEMKKGKRTGYFDSDQLADFAEHYASLQQYDEAFDVVSYALSIHPGSTEILVIKAHIFIELKRIDEAKVVANSIAENYERDVKLLNAELLIIENRLDESDKLLNEIINEEKDDYESILDVAFLYMDYEFPLKALPFFEKAIKISPNNNDVRINLADCYLQSGHLEKAVLFYNNLLDTDPYSTQYWFELGRVYYCADEFNKALEAYEFALTIDEQHKSSILMSAHCYFKLENYQKACDYYEKYDAIVPNSKMNIFFIGLSYFNLEKYDKAIEKLKVAVEMSEELAVEAIEIYDYIATSYDKLGFSEEALKYIDFAINKDPLIPDAYISKGKILLNKNEKEEANLWFNKAIDLDKKDPEILLEVGSVYFDSRNYEQALKYFLLVNQNTPGFKNIYILIAYTYAALKNIDEFNNYFSKASKQNPNNIIDSLSFITDEQEDLKRIINEITDAIEEKKDDSDIEDYNFN